MQPTNRYQVADSLRQICALLELSPDRVTRRAGFPPDFLSAQARSVSAREYLDLWAALEAEVTDPRLCYRLADAALGLRIDSAVHAFFASPTVRIGLERKALFKPLLAPVEMRVEESGGRVSVTFRSRLPDRGLPPLLGWFDLAFFLMAIRHGTGCRVIPEAICAPGAPADPLAARGYFGTFCDPGADYRMELSASDADLPLVSRDDLLWARLEPELKARFGRDLAPQTTAARVRQSLVEGLPGGQVTIEQIARALAMSKRSLQRRLSDEGASFKDILEDTRRAMALTYLQGSDLGLQEIAFLLGFRDTGSFFRAFRGWTGSTPQATRARLGHAHRSGTG